MTTFVSTGVLGFTNLSGDLPSGLLLTEQYEDAAFLVCNASGRFAVCLEPKSEFRAIELDAINEAWRGCFISDVQLQADISSAFTRAQQELRAGDLVINEVGIFIASRPIQLGHLPRLIQWETGAALGSGTITGAFSRWRVVRIQNDVIQPLKEVDSEA